MSIYSTMRSIKESCCCSSSFQSALLACVPTPPMETFQYPIDRHPLASLAEAIQHVKENRIPHERVAEMTTQLDPSVKELFSGRELAFLENPAHLNVLLSLVERMLRGEIAEDKGALQTAFQNLEEPIRKTLAGEIYRFSTDPTKGGHKWGERHAADNLGSLRDAILHCKDKVFGDALLSIDRFACDRFDALSAKERDEVFGTIYSIARPITHDSRWGENNTTKDIPRLITALFLRGKIAGPRQTGRYLRSWENVPREKSRFYTIPGRELAKGKIGFINGMGVTYGHGKWDAKRIAEAHTQGHAMECVYGATYAKWDPLSAIYGQKGIALPQSRLLVQKWGEFFAARPEDEKYLQICTSRGAIDVVAALRLLPEEKRNRIIVIAIAPGYLVESWMCHKAFNFVIEADHVPFLAPNSHLIGVSPNITVLPPSRDRNSPHNPHNASYRRAVAPLVDEYIRTNDIQIN